ncbi:MAG: DUF2079 domain-containing protein, partial [Thermoplasmata archaeon]
MKTTCVRLLHKDAYFYIAVLITIAFSSLFSYYSILRYYSIDATGFDLGIYSSALFSAIHGGLFYTNLINGSFLGNHFSPFMFLLVPAFFIYPHNVTLLVLQGFAIGLSGIPAYMIFTLILKDPRYRFIGILSLIVFEVSPILAGPISFDFHLMAFLPLFYLSSVYFLLKKRYFWGSVFIALSISLHAFFSVIIIFLLISLYIQKFLSNNKRSDSISEIVYANCCNLEKILFIFNP